MCMDVVIFLRRVTSYHEEGSRKVNGKENVSLLMLFVT